MAAAEAQRQAEAEGLTLLRSESSATGFQYVTINSSRKAKPYQAQVRRGGKVVYLGIFATAEEAALAYARSPEGRAATAAAAAAPAPLTAAEARRQAEAEGLTLLRSEGKATGFQGVSIKSTNKAKPYQAKVRRGGKKVYLGSFATAEEAALARARTPEGRAAAAAAAAVPAPLTAAEVLRQAEAEGLTLLRSASSASGFQYVTIDSSRSKIRPYRAVVRRGGVQMYLGRGDGFFATAEEAALAFARSPEGRAAAAVAAAAPESLTPEGKAAAAATADDDDTSDTSDTATEPTPAEQAAPPSEAPRLKAFVMGLKNYAGDNKLACPENDAVDLAELLISRGAHVTLLTDSRLETKRRLQVQELGVHDVSGNGGEVDGKFIEDEFMRWLAGTEEGEVLLIFYSGHAEEYNGASYIIPSTSGPSAKAAGGYAKQLHDLAVHVEWMMEQVEFKDVDARLKRGVTAIYLFDCCRFRHCAGAKGRTKGGTLAPPKARAGVLIGYACDTDKEANDRHWDPNNMKYLPVSPSRRNSPYTGQLLKFLGFTHDIREDLEHVSNAVIAMTTGWEIEQEPCCTTKAWTRHVCLAPRDTRSPAAITRPYAPGEKAAAKRRKL